MAGVRQRVTEAVLFTLIQSLGGLVRLGSSSTNGSLAMCVYCSTGLCTASRAATRQSWSVASQRCTHSSCSTTLGNLLWAAWGQNRPDGRRTAPSARNKQNLKVYVNKQDGLWLYDAAAHGLERIAAAPLGSPLNDAPVVLIFAVPKDDPYGDMHVGSVYQNVGLFCASAGLGNVVKASTTRDPARFSFLPEGWKAAATQSVGLPRR